MSPNAPLRERRRPHAMRLQAARISLPSSPCPSAYQQEGDGVSPTAVREIALLRELRHPNIVRLEAVHISRPDASISLAFDYAEHDLYEMIWHHRDRLQGEWGGVVVAGDQAVCAGCRRRRSGGQRAGV